jgi:CheY-like chemotaxis protein
MPKHILVVSTDSDLLRQVRSCFPDAQVEAVKSSAAAPPLTFAGQVVVVDLRAVGGLSLLRALQSSHLYGQMVVIALTDNDAEIVEALETGASDCLPLPLRVGLFRAKVKLSLEALARQGVRLGPYVVLGGLGVGSFGTVWRARNVDSGETVALKLLSPNWAADAEAFGRFSREVRLLGALKLAFVVRLVEAGRIGNRPYLAMEIVEGTSLREEIIRERVFSAAEGLRIASNLSVGLAGMHAHEVLHRDVKPSNVMLSAEGTATLIDLGLARLECDRSVTATSAIIGTPQYLAPEVVRGEKEHPGSDLYSLGATLWTLFTGRLPYEERTAYRLLEAIASNRGVAPLATLRPDLPTPLAELVDSLLVPNATLRVARASEVAARCAELETTLGCSGAPPLSIG